MAEEAIGQLGEVLLGIIGVELGIGVKQPTVDVIGDGSAPVAANLCTMTLSNTGSGSVDSATPNACNVLIDCGSSSQSGYDITNICTDPNGWFETTDNLIGDFKVWFQPGSGTAPWPGDVFVTLPQYDVNYGGIGTHDVPIGSCQAWTEGFNGKDCDGETVGIKACTEGFNDGSDHTLTTENLHEYGWNYYLAIPLDGQVGCFKPDS